MAAVFQTLKPTKISHELLVLVCCYVVVVWRILLKGHAVYVLLFENLSLSRFPWFMFCIYWLRLHVEILACCCYDECCYCCYDALLLFKHDHDQNFLWLMIVLLWLLLHEDSLAWLLCDCLLWMLLFMMSTWWWILLLLSVSIAWATTTCYAICLAVYFFD